MQKKIHLGELNPERLVFTRSAPSISFSSFYPRDVLTYRCVGSFVFALKKDCNQKLTHVTPDHPNSGHSFRREMAEDTTN